MPTLEEKVKQSITMNVPNYSVSPYTLGNHVISFITGFSAIFAILFIYYQLVMLSVIGGIVCGAIFIIVSSSKGTVKRKKRLRTQFFDMLEALSVSMRAGNNELNSLISTRDDLLLIYPSTSDIIVELSLIIAKFENNIPLSEAFSDFAERSQLEDIKSFSSIYKAIEGKSSRSNQIVRQTQQIIADKMEIEMEIDTLMTAAKSEVNIMLFMPLAILGIIGYMGSGFMDAIYTTTMGRIVATGGIIIFVISYLLAQKFSSVSV